MKRVKKNVINITIAVFVGIIVGFLLGSRWLQPLFSIDSTISFLDIISILATIGMGIYIVTTLEKEAQDHRVEKDLYISKVQEIEALLSEVEMCIDDRENDIYYSNITNVEFRLKRKKDKVFKCIISLARDEALEKIKEIERTLTSDFKDLRVLLTQTSAAEDAERDVNVTKNIVQYSPSRVVELQTLISKIQESLLDVNIIINKM